jgi:hypothetical protein
VSIDSDDGVRARVDEAPRNTGREAVGIVWYMLTSGLLSSLVVARRASARRGVAETG